MFAGAISIAQDLARVYATARVSFSRLLPEQGNRVKNLGMHITEDLATMSLYRH